MRERFRKGLCNLYHLLIILRFFWLLCNPMIVCSPERHKLKIAIQESVFSFTPVMGIVFHQIEAIHFPMKAEKLIIRQISF